MHDRRKHPLVREVIEDFWRVFKKVRQRRFANSITANCALQDMTGHIPYEEYVSVLMKMIKATSHPFNEQEAREIAEVCFCRLLLVC